MILHAIFFARVIARLQFPLTFSGGYDCLHVCVRTAFRLNVVDDLQLAIRAKKSFQIESLQFILGKFLTAPGFEQRTERRLLV